MIDRLAPKWGGLLVFPEERYYGESMPYGNESSAASAANLAFLTTAQVLEDYVEIIYSLKQSLPGAANCPVIAFGGSYGGCCLINWRFRYLKILKKHTGQLL